MLAIHAVETGVPAVPPQVDGTGLSVAVLSDDALRLGLILPFLLVVCLPVQKQDDIGVLLDGAGLTQIGKHGAVVTAAFRSAGEL